MTDWERLIIRPDASIREAMRAIDAGGEQLALVIDDKHKLLGTVTDGDIRRALLRGVSLDQGIALAMNTSPVVRGPGTLEHEIAPLVKVRDIRFIPTVDEAGTVLRLERVYPRESFNDFFENDVILMAGGLGSRLHPLTQEVPKSLIPVGGKPILETIIRRFSEQRFKNFTLAVNYKAEMIENHFGDGAHLGANISYLRENKRMGTAGALSLLQKRPTLPILLMNCDVLTNVRFDRLLDFHTKSGAFCTMAVREYEIQVPYGVVRTTGNSEIIGVDEKPIHKFFVNAGIYVFSPEVVELLEPGATIDATQLIERAIAAGKRCSAFPLCEYWIDVGQIRDLEKANDEFGHIFGPQGPRVSEQ